MLRPLTFATLLLTLAVSPAIEIRNYSSARHNRFVSVGVVTVPNANAYYDATLYTGVGYGDDGKQYTLIGPEHVLFAKHYIPATNGTYPIRFRNNSGLVTSRNVIGSTQVPNGSGGIADVIILKLSAPIFPETGITPLPYLNLARERDYRNEVITMFGKALRAGRGVISPDFGDFSQSSPNIDATRYFTTYYDPSSGNQDDAYAVTGDSGSPSFALANNLPALVGVHLAAGTTETGLKLTLDTFVPHYADTINSLLTAQGYQLIPAYPDNITLTSGIANSPLRQAEPGTIQITVSNTTPQNVATNPRLNLVFPAGAIPDSVTAPGWITYSPSPGDYRLRSASLSAQSSVTATISYAALPSVSEIAIQSTHLSDGSASTQTNYNLPITETFAGFTAALPLKGELDDADLDGIGNLLEYAFGGNPGTNSMLAEGGYPLAPQSSHENGLTFTYARRTDAAQRGLTYENEFSETLGETAWGTALPSGSTVNAALFDPDVPGFEKVTVTFPTTLAARRFVRVKVTLAE